MGHVTIPIVLALETYGSLPEWLALTLWPIFARVAVLAVLPRAKALLLTVIWGRMHRDRSANSTEA